MRVLCRSTVFGLMPRCRATCLAANPSATSRRTSLLPSRQAPVGGNRRKDLGHERQGKVGDAGALGHTDTTFLAFVLTQEHDPHSSTAQHSCRPIRPGRRASIATASASIGVSDRVGRRGRHGDRSDPGIAVQSGGDPLPYHRLTVSYDDGPWPHPELP